MRTLGLIGGMSWESTIPYYQQLNEGVKQRLGGLHSAQLILYSVDFAGIEQLQRDGAWQEAGRKLGKIALNLAAAGADGIVLCTNTMHKVADAIVDCCSLPFLHIVNATGEGIRQAGVTKVALLGTRYTMEQPFYRERLTRLGIESVVPNEMGRETVNRIIFEELCLGIINPESRLKIMQIVDALAAQGAQGVILGCTELGLLLRQSESEWPFFDSTRLHVDAALRFMFDER